MDNKVAFNLDAVRKIVYFAYETGYCDGIEDKYPEWKDYRNSEDFWQNEKEGYIKRFAVKGNNNL